jgi:large subunit ribosomal protein L4
MGEIRSPLWYHGGIVFGPKPRDYSYNVPKKVRRGALRSLLSERLRRGMIKVIDNLALETPKTKAFLAKFGPVVNAHKTVLFLDESPASALRLASRNVPGVKVTGIGEVNVYDLARYEMVVVTEGALQKLAEVLKP